MTSSYLTRALRTEAEAHRQLAELGPRQLAWLRAKVPGFVYAERQGNARRAAMKEARERMMGNMRLLIRVALSPLPEGIESFNMQAWRCGTAACMGGLLAMHPAANRQGLCLEVDVRTAPLLYLRLRNPEHRRDYIGMGALGAFLGISIEDAGELFGVHSLYLGPHSPAEWLECRLLRWRPELRGLVAEVAAEIAREEQTATAAVVPSEETSVEVVP